MRKLGESKRSPGGTLSGPHPGGFPVGSTESRAAAMALARGDMQVPIIHPVFVSYETVKAGDMWANIQRAHCVDGEFLREPGETVDAFKIRVLAHTRPGVGIAWSEK